VLMDLRMPHCDSIEATRRLREHDAGIKVLS
jgi:CheY-like chemotaxis protein